MWTCKLMASIAKVGISRRNFHGNSVHLKSFAQKYREFWMPRSNQPPYYHVTQVGDPVLRRKCDPVAEDEIHGPELKALVKIMTDVMRKHKCVGLSAPQIGIPLRVIAMEFKAEYKSDFTGQEYRTRDMQLLPLTVLVNPVMKVLDYEKSVFGETCASVVGYSGEVSRYRSVELVGVDGLAEAAAEGKRPQKQLQLTGWSARIAQHEMDHIDGVVFTDVMDRRSLACDCWQAVNKHSGRIRLTFDGSK